MPPLDMKPLGIAGLLAAVGLISAAPALTGYDAATGATSASDSGSTTPAPTVTRIVAQFKDKVGARVKGSATRTATGRKETFAAKLILPLPGTALGLTDAASAGDAEIVMRISRQGTVYAECSLDSAGVGGKPRVARYALNLVSRQNVPQQKTGFCELSVPPFGPGLPQPKPRDQLTLKLITADGEKTLADGVFVRK